MEQADLKGKVAIVTGSATGIGASTALGLARRGAHVVVNYSKSETEARATYEAAKAAAGEALLVQGDVSRDEDCKRLAASAMEAWGRIDILVNNAGTTKFASHHDLDALSAADFTNIYSVNVVGPYQMIRAAAPALRAHGEGAIVNISSVAGVSGVGSSIAYAASKGALNTMTLSFARSLAPEIRVNAVCPGYVATRWFSDRFGQEQFEHLNKTYGDAAPLKRVADADEAAKTVLFFCGPESRHITGEFMMTDGGMHLSIMPGIRR